MDNDKNYKSLLRKIIISSILSLLSIIAFSTGLILQLIQK